MAHNHLAFILAISLTITTSPAYAASDGIIIDRALQNPISPTCNFAPSLEYMVGNYEIETSPLRMTIAGFPRVFEQWEAGTGRIYIDDLRNLILTGLGGPVPEIRLIMADRLEPDWYWGSDATPSLAENNDPALPPATSFPAVWQELLNEYIDRNPNGVNSLDFIDGTSSAEIVTRFRCNIRDYPRFIGQFTTTAEDGTPLEHTMRLVMLRDDPYLIGSWNWVANSPQGTITATRAIFLDRIFD